MPASNVTLGLVSWFLLASLMMALTGCGMMSEQDSAGDTQVNSASIADAVPRVEPKSKYGNPRSYVVFGKRYHPINSSRGFVERGVASWYGKKFHGRRTSNQEVYNMYAMTAAHKTLPLPTYVAVTNLENGKRVILRVNDRGPFHDNRVIDLSFAAATKLDIVRNGTGLVEVVAIDPAVGEPPPSPSVVAGVSSKVQLYLQAGAFSIHANALRLQEHLRVAAGELAKISEAIVNGRNLYRVRIGPIADVSLADRLVQTLLSAGVTEPRIVLE